MQKEKDLEELLQASEKDQDIDISGITLEDILREVGQEDAVDPLATEMEQLTVKNAPERGLDDKSRKQMANGKVKKVQVRTPLQLAAAREERMINLPFGDLISPLQVKRKLRDKPLEGQTKPININTGVVKVESLELISNQLKRNLQFQDKGPGNPTAIAIHEKFIAIGTSMGLILVFDHFQNVRQVLGNSADAQGDGAVSAIDVSAGGDFLVCGYQSGRIVLWDMLKGTSLKAVMDAYDAPIVSLRFYKDQKPVIVSVDNKGVVKRMSFSKMMGYLYVVDTMEIFDGSAGKIPAIAVLPQQHSNVKCAQFTDQYSLLALSSEKVTFVIAIEPELKVLHQWPKPANVEADIPVLPSLSFDWVTISGAAQLPAAVIARGWYQQIDFLEIIFPGGNQHKHSKHGWPTFEQHASSDSISSIVATEWLGDQVVAYLNSKDELCVEDTMTKQKLETVDISSLELIFASYRGIEKDGLYARSFSNSFRKCKNALYLLGVQELRVARVQSWTQRIDTLVEDGEWLEGLAYALDHYEGLKKSSADRAERDRFPPVFFRDQRNDQCVVDIYHMCRTNQRTGDKEDVSRLEDGDKVEWICGEVTFAPDVARRLERVFQDAVNGEIEAKVPFIVAERVADLITDYVRLAIANAPRSSATSLLQRTGLNLDLASSHYQMLAGVCIEFCAIINRTDLLFGDIFHRFRDAGQESVFIDLLKPYILNDKLQYLSPEVLELFVKKLAKREKFNTIEQIMLHLKVKDLDTDLALKLCMKHRLYSALAFIYNEKQDYLTPLDIMLEASKASEQRFQGKSLNQSQTQTEESRERRLIGYKCLLYLSYCLQGKEFPQGISISSPEKVARIRAQISRQLFERDRVGAFSRLHTLVSINVNVLVSMLAEWFEMRGVAFEEANQSGDKGPESEYNKKKIRNATKCVPRLQVVLALAEVIVGPPGCDPSKSEFSSIEQSELYMFEARLLSSGVIDAREYAFARNGSEKGSWTMDSLMRYLVVGTVSSSRKKSKDDTTPEFDKEGRQEMLVRLLSKLTPEHYDEETLLRRVNQEKMNRAAVLMYKARSDFRKVMKAYLDDADDEYRIEVYNYIRNEYEKQGADSEAEPPSNTKSEAVSKTDIETGVLENIEQLLSLKPYTLVILVFELFPHLHHKIIQELSTIEGKAGKQAKYIYLKHTLGAFGKQVGEDDQEQVRDLIERSKIQMNEDSKLKERFVRLLCRFEPNDVFPYLEAHDNYSLDRCLKLCQEYGVTDAEAYLLERTGDVNGALSLILQSLEKKLKILKPALRGHPTTATSKGGWQTHQESVIDSVPEGQDVRQTLDVAIAICQRNSDRNRDEQSEKLWFTLLDKFLKVQNYVKRAILAKNKGVRSATRGVQTAMQVALNECIRIILERMSSFVSLKSILYTITNAHGKDEFGDFRTTIFGMLDTYSYEQNIFQTANSLISADIYQQVRALHKAQSKSIAPAASTCAYCFVSLGKPPFNISTNANGVKWTRQSANVMVKSTGQTFHESCGKQWQQENDKAAQSKKSKKSRSKDSEAKQEEAKADESSTASAAPVGRVRTQNTRRYLSRLAKARKTEKTAPSLFYVLDSLSKEETAKNKYLKTSVSSFSLQPAAMGKAKRISTRKPGSLPSKPVQRGSL